MAETRTTLRRAIQANVGKLSVSVYNCGVVPDRDTADDMVHKLEATVETGYPQSIDVDEDTMELRLTVKIYHNSDVLAQNPDPYDEDGNNDNYGQKDETITLFWSPKHKQLFTDPRSEYHGRTVFVQELAPGFNVDAIEANDVTDIDIDVSSTNEEKSTPPTTQEAAEEVTVYLKRSEDCIISAYSRATARSRTLLHRARGPTILHVVIE